MPLFGTPNSPRPPTIKERDAEIAALQAAFDEYIASSRELEDELDAELARMQDRLAESNAANSALMAQLEAQNPQYHAMEQELFNTKHKLEVEMKRKSEKDMAQEDLEARNREIQISLEQCQSKCSTLQEKLTMKEDEVDELRIELEVLKESHKFELEQLRVNAIESNSKLLIATSNVNLETEDMSVPKALNKRDTEKEDYVRRLEDELEDITEQLIKAEASVSELEAKVATADNRNVSLESMVSDLKDQINSLERANEISLNEGQRALSSETSMLHEKIDDLINKLTVTEEELTSTRNDAAKSLVLIENLKSQIRDNTKILSEDRATKLQISALENALDEANSTINELRDEVDNLMSALQDSKTDHTKALDEIDALKNAYDELEAAGKKLLKDKEAEWVLRYETGVQELSKRYPSLDDANEQTRKQLAETQNELACVQRKLAEFEDAEKRNPAVPIFTNSPRSKQSLKPMAFDEQDIIQAGMSLPRISSYRTCSRSRPRTLQSTLTRSRSCSPTAMERLEQAFINSTTQVQQLREECDSLGRQKRFSEVRVKHLEDDMSRIHQQLNISDSEQTPIRPMLPVVVEARDDDDGTNYIQNVMQTDDINLLKGECQSLLKKMILQRDHNALLLSKVLSLQGNIQVCCRVRPMKSSELKGGQSRLIEPLSETEVGCFDSRTKTWRSFVFDKVWGPDSTQQGVFQDVEPLALSVVEGYNACIFAYGQTGSGKTYTMEGQENVRDIGISSRTIQKLLHLLEHRARKFRRAGQSDQIHNDDAPNFNLNDQFKYEVNVSMLEIYNDEVYDLLTPSTSDSKMKNTRKESLDVKRGKNGALEVPGLTKVSVRSLQDVQTVLKTGHENRATSTTNMNEHSSRSHMVLKVEVTTISENETNIGNLYLVDLAGSERVAKSEVAGQELKEAGHINKSLSALGNVMEALDRKSSHIPYRDSKLTYLLQDSLGGNSRTMMVVTVCPTSSSVDESLCALHFAQRVRRIHLGSAQRNVQSKNLQETIKAMSAEMKLLMKAKEISEEQLQEIKRDHARIQERLRSNAASSDKNSDGSQTNAFLKSSHAEITARWQKEKRKLEDTCIDLDRAQNELKTVQQLLTKTQRERDNLSSRLQEKENEFINLEKNLRKAKEATTAATLRARTAQVVRQGRIAQGGNSSPTFKPVVGTTNEWATPPHLTTSSATCNIPDHNPYEVRKMVLSILQEFDPNKVGKIDVIMERFKGREAYLLEKMTQRYLLDDASMMSKSVWTNLTLESMNMDGSLKSATGNKSSPYKNGSTSKLRTPSDSSTKASKSDSAKRSEAALARHMERMKVRT